MGCCNRDSALSDQQQGVGSKGSVDRGWQGLDRGQVGRGPPAQVSPELAVAFEREETDGWMDGWMNERMNERMKK